jgi:hypothetical protein
MLLLQARFAKGHNRRRGLLGPLWQSRYKARIVEDQKYFEQLLAYIHLNPVSAGLVGDPAHYRWSGHSALLGLRASELVDVDETLSSFGPTKGEAREQYLAKVRICAETKWLQLGIRSLPWWSTVKNDEELVAPQFGRSYWDYKGNRINVERPTVPIDLLFNIFCDHLMFDANELKGRSTKPSVANARALFAALAIERYGISATHVANLLGKNPGSVSRWLTRARDETRICCQLDYLDECIRTEHSSDQ